MERENRHALSTRCIAIRAGRSHSISMEYRLKDLQSAPVHRFPPLAQFILFAEKDLNSRAALMVNCQRYCADRVSRP